MPSKKNDEDSRALGESALQINPEVLEGVSLPGLSDVELVSTQHVSVWARWTEGLSIHVVGSGLVAVIAFIAGLMFSVATNPQGISKESASCVVTTAPAPKKS
jgi:hypothetical protein